MKKREIIVLQGPPACGKSTYAKKLHEEDKRHIIVSRDDIRASRGNYWIPDQEGYITAVEEFEVRTAVEMGLIPVIDATNLNETSIKKWNDLATELGAELDIREMDIPTFEVALMRDANRERSVGYKVMKKFYSAYYPHLMEENRKMKEFTDKPKCIIVDIDGTISLRGPRSIFDYSKVYLDKPDFRITTFLKEVLNETQYEIIFLTGRDAECRDVTIEWLEKHFCPQYWINMGVRQPIWKLYMRSAGDRRPDFEVKKEIYKENIEPWNDVIAVFEDRDQCVDMWREEGILCLQPARGNF